MGQQILRKATFAGGCFWCMQKPFDIEPGVVSTVSGYTGGDEIDPTYQEVSSGATGHAEAVEITFDPNIVSYGRLLEIFWKNIDPTMENGQFADIGTHYRTSIFFHDEEQKKIANESLKTLQQSGKFSRKIVTEIVPAGPFYPAEEYHQGYYQKQPSHYNMYRIGSGREGFIKKTWGENN